MSNSAFTPTTTEVTTEVPVNVPVVTAWESYTPTFEGLGTVSSVIGNYRRIGDTVEITGSLVCGTPTAVAVTISLPSGLNIDTSKIHPTLGQVNSLGYINRGNSTSTSMPSINRGPWSIVESRNASTSKVYIGPETDTDAGGIFVTYLGTNLATSGDRFTFSFSAPISQWAGSGTTTLATRAVEEYAFNTSTSTTTSDTSSFGYGPSGSQIQNITAGLTRRVRFQTPIQSTDKFCLEVSINRVNWQDVSYRFGDNATSDVIQLTRQLTSTYGVGYIVPINSTDIDVTFGQYAEPASATYGGAGRAWSAGAGSWYWRVRKVSSGAQVGYPVSARNIVGDTSGTAVPTGMIGETLTPTYASSGAISSGTTNTEYASVTLSAGVWRLSGNIQVALGATAPSGWTTLIAYIQTTVAAPVDNRSVSGFDSSNSFTFIPGNSNWAFAVPELIVNVSSTTTYRLVVRTAMTTPNSAQHRPDISRLNAVRIA